MYKKKLDVDNCHAIVCGRVTIPREPPMPKPFTSASEQLRDVLRTDIEEGMYRPGQKIPTERELSRRWEVARLTVARALEDLVGEGLIERRPSRGTFVTERVIPPRAADRPGAMKRIGLCFLDLYRSTHPYFARLTKSLTEHCAREGTEFALFTLHAGDLYYRRQNPLVENLRSGTVDGLLVAGRMSIADLFALQRSHLPFVWMNHEMTGEDIPAVLVDYAWGAFQAVRYLVDMGHVRIGLVLGTRRNRASSLSQVGYQLAHEAAELPVSPELIRRGRFDSETGYLCAKDLLTIESPPTAVLTADDVIAIGVLRAAHEMGLRVPEDLSVIGCGNFFEPHDTAVALTTLEIHLQELARSAVALLRSVATNVANVNDDILIRPDLIKRDSTAPPGGPRT